MEKVLSQGEMDALFRAARSPTGTGAAEDGGTRVAASDLEGCARNSRAVG